MHKTKAIYQGRTGLARDLAKKKQNKKQNKTQTLKIHKMENIATEMNGSEFSEVGHYFLISHQFVLFEHL